MYEGYLEKRNYPRYELRIPIRYRKIDKGIAEYQAGLVKNISEGGMRITTYGFLPLNLKLALDLPLQLAVKPIQGVGRVAWVSRSAFGEQYEAGLQFLNLNQGDEERINKFVFDKTVETLL